MAETKGDPEWTNFIICQNYLLDKIINCERKHLFFNGLSHSEKEIFIESAIVNNYRLKSLQVSLRELLKYDSKLIEKLVSNATSISRIYYYINLISIEKALLNLAKAEAIKEKRKLEVQFDTRFRITTASVEVHKQREQKNVEEQKEQNVITKSFGNHKIEPYNVKGNTEAEKYSESKRLSDGSRSIQQSCCKIELDENDTESMKLILHKNELENTSAVDKTVESSDSLCIEFWEIRKPLNLDTPAKINRNKNGFLDEIKGEKSNISIETLKPSYKPTEPEDSSIESEISQQNLLESLNLEIENYEKKMRSIEDILKFYIEIPNNNPLKEIKLDNNFSKVLEEELSNKSKKQINISRNSIISLQSIKGANSIMRDANNYFFNDLDTTDISTNVFNGDIQTVKHDSYISSKIKGTSSLEGAFESDSINEEENGTPDKLVLTLTKNDILFELDSDGNKVFKVDDQDLFFESKSTKVVLNYKDEKVQISFIDNHIAVSTENSELDVSFGKTQPVNIQDDETQTQN